MALISVPQEKNIQLNRVYRRAEFADKPPSWGSPMPTIEIKGEGSIAIYVSNLPRNLNAQRYVSPIEDTLLDIQDKMTPMTDCNGELIKFKQGIHDACACTVWIAFIWCEDSITPPIIRDSCLIDWELVYRQDTPPC